MYDDMYCANGGFVGVKLELVGQGRCKCNLAKKDNDLSCIPLSCVIK